MSLTKQFLEACGQFAEQIDTTYFQVFVMAYTHMKTEPSADRPSGISFVGLIYKWIETGISEIALITGVIKAMETVFLKRVLDYEETRKLWQEEIDFAEKMLSDSDAREDWENFVRDTFPKPKVMTDDKYHQWIEFNKRLLENPDDNLPERNHILNTWREVTKPILEDSNLVNYV